MSDNKGVVSSKERVSTADLEACRSWLVARGDSLARSRDMILMVDELLERRSSETRGDAEDAARYRAIRAARVGASGCCEIWNVAYTGRNLDDAVDAVRRSQKAVDQRAIDANALADAHRMYEAEHGHPFSESEGEDRG